MDLTIKKPKVSLSNKKKYILTGVLLSVVMFIVVGFFLNWLYKPAQIFSQVVTGGTPVLKSSDGLTNILLLGIDARPEGNVESGVLTDSIMLVSVDIENETYSMISFPRDLWIDKRFDSARGNYRGKINGIYSWGNGVDSVIEAVEYLSGEEIHYYVVVSFDGFITAVDALGGIEVDVTRSFDDYRYPIEGIEEDLCGMTREEVEDIYAEVKRQEECLEEETCVVFETEEELEEKLKELEEEKKKNDDDDENDSDNGNEEEEIEYLLKQEEPEFLCRYQHVSFAAGRQIMEGETALRYARSRYAIGEEGTDFARAARQQQVMVAVKEKVLSLETLANPLKMKELYDTYKESVTTNIGLVEAQGFYGLVGTLSRKSSVVLDDRSPVDEGGVLYSLTGLPEYNGAFVLLPLENNYGIIREFVQGVLRGRVPTSAENEEITVR